ncbi:phosphatase PAP2 family protein [Variovorax sp. Root411]|uniref:phosphatase PAP2 family protein n=1 Tax=Variovorax sp. Root411 TaxID=1736530 RepID=UPI0006FCCD67|nr:phosphatase PAP2 family protein [Variovorax sp. Root411]KQW63996.1 hypothetical protein ASC92_00635 [Variovorax sp. Root411]
MRITRKLCWLSLVTFLFTACTTQVPSPTGVPPLVGEKTVVSPARDKTYLDAGQIDTTRFLAPPPDEAVTRREIEQMLVLQQQRTPVQAERSIADLEQSVSSGSYPSGHSTFAYLAGIVLAEMVPEKRAQIFARASEFGENRVLGGVHYPSDIEAGRRLATMIAVLIQGNPAYQGDFAAAREELRAWLGLDR